MRWFHICLLAVFLVRLFLHFIPGPSITPPPSTCSAPPPPPISPPIPRALPRPYDLCVYGATGFTGTLVASYLAAHPSLPNDFKWCIAGRSEAKLKKLRAELDKETASLATWRGSALPELVVADASSPESLASLASSAKVVLTTVGPYTLYGMPLVEACAVAGTHYADLSGEFFFQADAIKNFDAAAVSSGASIVVASGYDSIPFDIGADLALSSLGVTSGTQSLTSVSAVVTMCHGSASGGTIASAGQGMKDMYHGIKDGTMTMEYANDPYILVPELANLSAADASCTRTDTDATGFGNLPRFDRVFSSVSIPHFMAYVNSKVVRRSQFLLRPNARISYSESMTVASMIDAIWWSIPHWISGEIPMMPAQGGGPGSVAREKGGFAIKVKASNAELGDVEFEGVGSGDPGYAHTSRILAEVGLCLLDDECKTKGGGVKTVASSVRSSELRKRFAAATGPDGNPLLVYTKVAGKGGAGGEL